MNPGFREGVIGITLCAMKGSSLALLAALVSVSVVSNAAAQSAFPGAQGFGARATGGRGGSVVRVTTLAPAGQGSLQWALDQPGPRIIVFAVSGVIESDIDIPHGDVTIAGQTAPGAGITINGHLTTPYGQDIGNIIMRHIRVRPPGANGEWPGTQHDGAQMSSAHTLMFDHVAVSHGVDENVDLWAGASDITIQWSAITFPRTTGHPEGEHNYCLINSTGTSGGVDGGRISVHHNLFAHCKTRTPALGMGPADVINNVVYNAREAFVHHNDAYGEFNIIGNYYKDGPSADLIPLWLDPENSNPPVSYHVANNWVDHPGGDFEGRFDNPFTTQGFDYSFHVSAVVPQMFQSQRFDYSGNAGYVQVSADDPAQAYTDVLDHAGSCPRDFVTRRAVQDTQDRSGAWQSLALDNLLLGLTPGQPPVDMDSDGMPDSWETAHGLDPSDGGDHSAVQSSGYTAIEVYINELADTLCGFPPQGSGGAGGSGTGGSGGSGAGGTASGGTGAGGTSGQGASGPGAAGGVSQGGSSGTGTGAGGTGAGAGSGPGGTNAGGAQQRASGGSDDGGCGCSQPARSPGPTPIALGLLLGLALVARRKSVYLAS